MNCIFEEYKKFVNLNKNLVPSFEHIPLIKQQNRFQYVGGQIDNGTLYSVVNSAERMLAYDISKGEMHFLGDFNNDDFKWTAGGFYEGDFYSFPRTSDSLLVYHPKTKAFEEIFSGFDYTKEHHYGGVLTKDGIIYQPPRNTNHILRWDIKTKTCEKIVINDGAICRYCASIIHPNGYAYFIPERDFRVIKLNLKTGELSYIGEAVEGYAFDPKIAPNGNIYGFRATNGLLKLDTQSEEVSVLSPDTSIGAYGTKCGINGKFYSLPGYTKDVWEFDFETEKIKKCHTIDKGFEVNFAGGAIDRNGDIYALPVYADSILKLGFNKFVGQIPNDIYEAFFTDFY